MHLPLLQHSLWCDLPGSTTLRLPMVAIAEASDAATAFVPRGITPADTAVFAIGCVPFLWAAVEFWRRIAVGDPFGTGSDSVYINDSSGERPRPARRVLGKDAILAARVLFGLAIAAGALVLLAGVDVLSRTS